MNDEFYRFCVDRYNFELSRRNELSGSLAIPVGIMSLIGGAIYSMLKELRWTLSSEEVFLVTFGVASLAAMVASAVALGIAFAGRKYRYVSTSEQIRGWREEVIGKYLSVGATQAEAEAHADYHVRELLEVKLSVASHHNTLLNDQRAYMLGGANLGMLAGLLFAFCAGSLDLYISMDRAEPVTKVEVVAIPSSAKEQARHEQARSEPIVVGSDSETRSSATADPAPATVGPPDATGRPVHQGGQESVQGE